MFGAYWFAAPYFADGPGPATPPPIAGGDGEDLLRLGDILSVGVTTNPLLGGSGMVMQ